VSFPKYRSCPTFDGINAINGVTLLICFMELTALALFLTTTPQAFAVLSLPGILAVDSQHIPHHEQAAGHSDQAITVERLLVSRFADQLATLYPLAVAA
jgi:hypothetical protein